MKMDDEQLAAYLRENGYAEHLAKAGCKGLITRWDKFVHEVVSGYRLGLEDYRNDLDLRGIIAMAGLDNEVRGADEQLRQMLVRTDLRVWESGVKEAFWDYGYPKNATGELLRDLQGEGLT